MNAVATAATSPSDTANQKKVHHIQERNMDRFSHRPNRYFTEVNVQGFDLNKSITKARKLKDKARSPDSNKSAPDAAATPKVTAADAAIPVADPKKPQLEIF